MKKLQSVMVLLALIFSSSLFAGVESCKPEYMYDPCVVDSYSIVESEKAPIRGKHNWMVVAHDFDEFVEMDNRKQTKCRKRSSQIAYYKPKELPTNDTETIVKYDCETRDECSRP